MKAKIYALRARMEARLENQDRDPKGTQPEIASIIDELKTLEAEYDKKKHKEHRHQKLSSRFNTRIHASGYKPDRNTCKNKEVWPSSNPNQSMTAPIYQYNGHTIWGATAMMLSEFEEIYNRVD